MIRKNYKKKDDNQLSKNYANTPQREKQIHHKSHKKLKKKSQENPPKMMAKIYNVKEQIQNHFKGSD